MKTKANKLTKLVLLLSLSLTTFIAVSNNTPVSKNLTAETEKTIRNYFKFPQVLIPHHDLKITRANKVEVLFTTDKTGNVNFVLAKTNNLQLKREIEKQFLSLHLEKVKQDVVHSVVLNFKTI